MDNTFITRGTNYSLCEIEDPGLTYPMNITYDPGSAIVDPGLTYSMNFTYDPGPAAGQNPSLDADEPVVVETKEKELSP